MEKSKLKYISTCNCNLANDIPWLFYTYWCIFASVNHVIFALDNDWLPTQGQIITSSNADFSSSEFGLLSIALSL